jgi:hypothetical protein
MDSPGVLFQAPTGHKFSPGKTLQHILSSAPWPWEMHGNAANMTFFSYISHANPRGKTSYFSGKIKKNT